MGTEDGIAQIASETEYTVDELESTESELIEAIQSNLNDHFKKAHLQAGTNHWLFENRNGRAGIVWLALSIVDIRRELRDAGFEFDLGRASAVGTAHLMTLNSSWEATVAIPESIAKRVTEPAHYPIRVPFPDAWTEGEHFTYQQFDELVTRFDMTPAEALDYWVVERGWDEPIGWAGARDVNPEAVRKNVRQAKEKLDDESLGATHEVNNITVVPIDELPEEGEDIENQEMRYMEPKEREIELKSIENNDA